MLRLAFAAVLAVAATAAVAQSDPVAERNRLMKSMGQNLYGTINGIVRGQAPYDQARVDAAFAALEADLAKAQPLYATRGDAAPGSNFRPLPKIWETKADFDARFVETTRAVAANKQVKSAADLGTAFTNVNRACTACHEQYRTRN